MLNVVDPVSPGVFNPLHWFPSGFFCSRFFSPSTLQSCQVVHRDIKPENLVLKEPTEQTVLCRANVKLIDAWSGFGGFGESGGKKP